MRWHIPIILILAIGFTSAASIEILGPSASTGSTIELITAAITSFLDHDDTPSSYTGANSFCVTVNGAGTALVFRNCSVAGGEANTQKTTNGFFLFNDTTTIFFNGTQLNQTIIQLDTNISNTEKTTNGFFLFNNSNTIFFNGTQLNQTIVQLDTNISNTEKNTNGFFLFNNSATIFFNGTQLNQTIVQLDTNITPDFTNVAFVNNTQTFTEPNRFTDAINITELNNLSMGSCTVNWNGSCLNTMCDGSLVMSVGCI